MGTASSKSAHRLDKQLGTSVPDDEHFFGLENFDNTCYCNSVLQALYYCRPFRDACIASAQQLERAHDRRGEDLLQCLCELFNAIYTQKKRCGILGPRKFVHKLRQENELFRSNMHQDAHEFLNYLLNQATEILDGTKAKEREQGQGQSQGLVPHAAPLSADNADSPGEPARKRKTWVHAIFEGTLTNETKCLTCETVTTRDEDFLDLSLDIEQNSSVSSCLRSFWCSESLRDGDKYFCDTCCSLQEAQKCLKIKRWPRVLALHLKRFKYIEQLGRYKKLSYRVVFPHDLRVAGRLAGADAEQLADAGVAGAAMDTTAVGPGPGTADPEACDDDEEVVYDLFAVVIHVGQGPNHGHYVSIVKSHNRWLLFDDETVQLIDEQATAECYGTTQEGAQSTDVGYLLFYQARDCTLPPSVPVPERQRAKPEAAA